MSFTAEIKTELCRTSIPNAACAVAEMMGLALFSAKFGTDCFKTVLSVPAMEKRVITVLRKGAGIPEGAVVYDGGSVCIEDDNSLNAVFEAIGYRFSNDALHVNFAALEDDECRAAFLRGAFLAGGYVSVSSNGYHLELVTHRFGVAKQTRTLLLEMEMPCGMTMRRGNHVLYYKRSTIIEEFLTRLGAMNSAMELMLTKVEKDVNNKINRVVNCGTANLERIAGASKVQLDAIAELRRNGRLDTLPAQLRKTAEIRENNPELSLSELSQLFDPPLTRSGLNNRLKKIIAISKE